MPLYEFQCKKCNYIFEEFFKPRTVLAMECPKCKGLAEKVISKSNFVVNGHNAKNGYSKKGARK